MSWRIICRDNCRSGFSRDFHVDCRKVGKHSCEDGKNLPLQVLENCRILACECVGIYNILIVNVLFGYGMILASEFVSSITLV